MDSKKIRIREAELSDADRIIVRDADVRELAATNTSPHEGVFESIRHSTKAWTAETDEGIICVWGVCPHPEKESVGVVWLLGSDLIGKVKKRFLIETLNHVREMHEHYDQLFNLVMKDNHVSKRWLKWAGATFHDTVDVNGYEFETFSIGKPCVM